MRMRIENGLEFNTVARGHRGRLNAKKCVEKGKKRLPFDGFLFLLKSWTPFVKVTRIGKAMSM